MGRMLAKLRDNIIGVKCIQCDNRVSLEKIKGCAKCGEACCTDCTVGDTESRICPSCIQEG